MAAGKDGGLAAVVLGGFCLTFCTIQVWWIVDCVLFGLNNISDENGVPLASW